MLLVLAQKSKPFCQSVLPSSFKIEFGVRGVKMTYLGEDSLSLKLKA